MRHKFQAEQWLAYPVAFVFDFFANPANLPPLMPDWQRAQISSQDLTAPPPPVAPERHLSRSVAAGQGSRMTITFRPVPGLPLRLSWDAEITEFAWDDHFCDVQLKRGPFSFWRHCHRLEPQTRTGQPGTGLRDEVEYELPLGLLGDAAHLLFVQAQMRSLFAYRHRRTEELLSGL